MVSASGHLDTGVLVTLDLFGDKWHLGASIWELGCALGHMFGPCWSPESHAAPEGHTCMADPGSVVLCAWSGVHPRGELYSLHLVPLFLSPGSGEWVRAEDEARSPVQ